MTQSLRYAALQGHSRQLVSAHELDLDYGARALEDQSTEQEVAEEQAPQGAVRLRQGRQHLFARLAEFVERQHAMRSSRGQVHRARSGRRRRWAN